MKASFCSEASPTKAFFTLVLSMIAYGGRKEAHTRGTTLLIANDLLENFHMSQTTFM